MKTVIKAVTFLVLLNQAKSSTDRDHIERLYSSIENFTSQNLYNTINKRNSPNFDWNYWMKPIETQPDNNQKKRTPEDAAYDFIIVGSGSAGAVIANRLSEVPTWNVLLLEAGKGENFVSQIPLVAPVMSSTQYNWYYFMERQENLCQGLVDERMHWPRGRALGGTTVINYMIYTRGNRLDFDRWAGNGNPGWSYRDVLPYYIKAERANIRNADYRVHGTQGPMGVEDIYQSELLESFVLGGQELGSRYIDYNANTFGLGVSTMQATVLKGRRHSVAKAYLQPVRNRPNLRIVTSAYVTKLLINKETREAYGVEYEKAGRKYRVEAKREVVLSAGTFNSPQLLMLAGIGPRQHLEDLGIPVFQDLPVGRNLHDHLTFPGLAFTLEKDVSLSARLLLTKDAFFGFFLNGTGPYTSLGGVSGIGYIKTPLSRETADIPDIEMIFVDGSLSTDYGLFTRRWMNINDQVYDRVFRPLHNVPTWTIFPMLLHPKSTGWIELKSRDPHDHPRFYGNFFTDPENLDLDTFVASIRWIQALSETEPFRKLGSKLNLNRMPGCDDHSFDSDDYWRCALRSISVTLHHQVGTCKMGPPDDPTSVVNHQLRVYGVGRLRVADSSVIPFAIGAHTNAPAIMVGEKAADLIKETWGAL